MNEDQKKIIGQILVGCAVGLLATGRMLMGETPLPIPVKEGNRRANVRR